MKSKRAFESLQELFWFTSPEKGKEENIEELVKSRPIYQMKNTSKRGMFVQLTHNKVLYSLFILIGYGKQMRIIGQRFLFLPLLFSH